MLRTAPMGCVSGEELLIQSASQSMERAKVSLAKDWPALHATVDLVTALRRERPAVTVPDFDQTLADASTLLKHGAAVPAYRGPVCQVPRSHEDIEKLQREAEHYHALARKTEDALCVLRCWLASAVRDAPLAPRHRLARRIAEQMALHRAHREEDRREAIRRCQDGIRHAARWSKNPAVERAYRERLAQLEALEESVLLCDRRSTDVA
jgi:hypothetical protein